MKSWFKAMLIAALALSLGGFGCKGKEGEGGGEGEKSAGAGKAGKLDEGKQYALEAGAKDLAEVKELLAKGEDTSTSCAATLGFAEQLKDIDNADAKALLKDARQVCNHDAPLAAIEREVKKAEEARAAKPDENPLSECYNATYKVATETVEKFSADDAKLKELKERFDKVCPKS